jgi:hypothetical protein
MSLLDQVHEFEQQIVERLRELEPLIGEYNQLRQLAERLGVSYTPEPEGAAAATAPARRRGAAKKRATRRSAKPRGARRTPAKSANATPAAGPSSARSARKTTAPAKATRRTSSRAKTSARRSQDSKPTGVRPGQRTEDVLRVVGEQPGITVREIGGRLGVDATGLYRVANKLTGEGRLRKDGTKLYAVASSPAAQPDTAAESAQPDGANADA